MAYATYEDYTLLYGGSRLSREEFEGELPRAEDYLELLTYGRCAQTHPPAVAQAIKMACCAMVEEVYSKEREPELRSERVGQWSRTYRVEASPERRIADAARRHLTGTGLLWRGWKRAVSTLE